VFAKTRKTETLRNTLKKPLEHRRKKLKRLRKPRKKPSSRVFSWAVDKVAFIDKIVVGVNDERNPNFQEELQHHESFGIYTPDSLYSRAASGILWLSGNRVDLVYGKKKQFRNVPALKITMHSERIPVTAAQVKLLVGKLIVNSGRVRVSQLEFTYDFTGVSIEYVLAHLIHRAKTAVKVLSDGKRKTIYVGSPRSAWQGRIYQKTDSVLRLEFILRRSFLSRHGINQPEDLLLLRKLNVWKLMSVRRLSTHNPGVLRRTRLQRKLEAMQRRFVW